MDTWIKLEVICITGLVLDLAKYQTGQIPHVDVPVNVSKKERQKKVLTITVTMMVMQKSLETHLRLCQEMRSKQFHCHRMIGL